MVRNVFILNYHCLIIMKAIQGLDFVLDDN